MAEAAQPAASSSMVTVAVAFGANFLIAVAKTIVAGITGSASMVAEAAHSWADTGNEIFLFIAERRGDRRRDDGHPLGFGRESYVWSMFAAFGIFTAGAVVSISHGITQLREPEEATNYTLAYVVLAVAFLLEGTSFLQALRQTRREAKQRGREPLTYIANTSNPTLRAVFAEDAAALIGLLIAGAGIGLHQLTGSPVWDAVGSILVGVLLGLVALFLIDRNRRFLIGENVPADLRARVLAGLLERDDVDRVTYLHIEFVGSGKVFLVAAVDITGDKREHDVAILLRRIEAELEQLDAVEEAVLTLSTPDEPSLPVPVSSEEFPGASPVRSTPRS